MYSFSLKKRASGRISVWALVFAIMLMAISSTLMLSTSASNGIGNAARDMGNAIGNAAEDIGSGVGEAVFDVGDGMGEAVTDMESGLDDGKVNDTDGMIGNEDSGADKEQNSDSGTDTAKPDTTDKKGNGGWIALAIAIVVITAVVVLLIILIPRRKDKE